MVWSIAPRILNLGTIWKQVVSFTPRPLYTRGPRMRLGKTVPCPCRNRTLVVQPVVCSICYKKLRFRHQHLTCTCPSISLLLFPKSCSLCCSLKGRNYFSRSWGKVAQLFCTYWSSTFSSWRDIQF